jgi:hypothetical protein
MAGELLACVRQEGGTNSLYRSAVEDLWARETYTATQLCHLL